jgi:hypothetical protein
MTKPFAPKIFLRQVPNPLLKEFFDRRHLLSDVLWYMASPQIIFDRWQGLPDEQRIAVERSFHDIHDMATEDGIRTLIEEGHFHELDLTGELEACDGYCHKAMHAFLRYEKVFYVASQFNYVEKLGNRYWEINASVPRKTPLVAAEALAAFARSLSDFYRQREGRGHHCTVETYLRGGREHYFFAYPDNYTETYIGHAPDGQLIRRPQRGAFEVIFVYCPEEGTLELYAKSPRPTRLDLQRLFCTRILHEDLGPQLSNSHVYELDGLLSRDFQFPTDPEDGVAQVCIRSLRVSAAGSSQGRITLETDANAPPDAIYDLLTSFIRSDFLVPGAVHVTKAAFQFQFIAANGTPRKKMLFDVTLDSSNLKNLYDEQRILGEKYLKRWGIYRGSSVTTDLAARGST